VENYENLWDHAVTYNCIESLNWLNQKGKCPISSLENNFRRNLLIRAMSEYRIESCRWLLEHGLVPDTAVLCYAATCSSAVPIEELFNRSFIKFERDGVTLLRMAASVGSIEVLQFLKEKKVAIDKVIEYAIEGNMSASHPLQSIQWALKSGYNLSGGELATVIKYVTLPDLTRFIMDFYFDNGGAMDKGAITNALRARALNPDWDPFDWPRYMTKWLQFHDIDVPPEFKQSYEVAYDPRDEYDYEAIVGALGPH
jgi:hypothetical protein